MHRAAFKVGADVARVVLDAAERRGEEPGQIVRRAVAMWLRHQRWLAAKTRGADALVRTLGRDVRRLEQDESGGAEGDGLGAHLRRE